MARLHRGIVCLASFTLAAAALLAQGSRPETPTTPISGGAAPQVVDRNGTVVGTLSAHTGLVFTLPDGRKTLLGWSRNGLSNAAPLDGNWSHAIILFRTPDCSGDAYVDFHSSGLPGDPMAMILNFPDPTPVVPNPVTEGAEPTMAPDSRVLYASETGARLLLRAIDFQSHYLAASGPFPCNPGLDPAIGYFQDGFIPAYRFSRTTVDLNDYEYPFHVVE